MILWLYSEHAVWGGCFLLSLTELEPLIRLPNTFRVLFFARVSVKVMKPCNTYLEFPDVPLYPEMLFQIRLYVIWKSQPHSLQVPANYLSGAPAIKTWSLGGAEQNHRNSFLLASRTKWNKGLNSTLEGKIVHWLQGEAELKLKWDF